MNEPRRGFCSLNLNRQLLLAGNVRNRRVSPFFRARLSAENHLLLNSTSARSSRTYPSLPQVTVGVVVLRETNERLEAMLVERKNDPAKNTFAFPGMCLLQLESISKPLTCSSIQGTNTRARFVFLFAFAVFNEKVEGLISGSPFKSAREERSKKRQI